MKLQHAISLWVVAAGTFISASGSRLPTISAVSLFLTIAGSTASVSIPLTITSLVFLYSTPVTATENSQKLQVAGKDSQVKVMAGMGATPQALSGSLSVNAKNVLQADVSASHGQHGQQLSAGAQVNIPLPVGDNSKLSVGGRASEYSPKGAGGQSFHDNRAHAVVELNKNLQHGQFAFRGGAEFPRGGPAQPFVGLQYQLAF